MQLRALGLSWWLPLPGGPHLPRRHLLQIWRLRLWWIRYVLWHGTLPTETMWWIIKWSWPLLQDWPLRPQHWILQCLQQRNSWWRNKLYRRINLPIRWNLLGRRMHRRDRSGRLPWTKWILCYWTMLNQSLHRRDRSRYLLFDQPLQSINIRVWTLLWGGSLQR